jgi:hypothetical protein
MAPGVSALKRPLATKRTKPKFVPVGIGSSSDRIVRKRRGDELRELVSKAERGDVAAARALLTRFVNAVQYAHREHIPTALEEQLVRYLARGFSRFLQNGAPLDVALGVRPSRGRPASRDTAKRDLRIVNAMLDALEEHEDEFERYTVARAAKQIGPRRGVSQRQAQRIFAKYGPQLGAERMLRKKYSKNRL